MHKYYSQQEYDNSVYYQRILRRLEEGQCLFFSSSYAKSNYFRRIERMQYGGIRKYNPHWPKHWACSFLKRRRGVTYKQAYSQTSTILNAWVSKPQICPYTGIILVHPGWAHLDHVVPHVKGGFSELGNAQFISIAANRIKGDKSHQQMCELMYKKKIWPRSHTIEPNYLLAEIQLHLALF